MFPFHKFEQKKLSRFYHEINEHFNNNNKQILKHDGNDAVYELKRKIKKYHKHAIFKSKRRITMIMILRFTSFVNVISKMGKNKQ